MTYLGADVAELRAVAQTCDQAATSVRSIVLRLNGVLGATPWAGPDAASFRSTWHGVHRVALADTESALLAVATVLRRNAEQQEQVSAASTGATSTSYDSSRVSSSYGEKTRVGDVAPANAQQLWYTLRNMQHPDKTGDGYRIQTVLGPDGKTRMVVYINGTYGGKDLGLWSNGQVVMHAQSAETAKVEVAIAASEKAAAASGSPVSEVMLVGYSQGGMIAQNVASTGAFHVSTVLTYGSPVVDTENDYGGATMIRVTDTSDIVPRGIVEGGAATAQGIDEFGAYIQGQDPSIGSNNLAFAYADPRAAEILAAARDEQTRAMAAAALGAIVDPVAGVPIAAATAIGSEAGVAATQLFDLHGSTWMYGDDAAAFDTSQNADALVAQANIARFGGIVTADVH